MTRRPLRLELLLTGVLLLPLSARAAAIDAPGDQGGLPAPGDPDFIGPPLPPGWQQKVAAAGLGQATPDQPLGNQGRDSAENYFEGAALNQVAENHLPGAPEVAAAATPAPRAQAISSRGNGGLQSSQSRAAVVSAPMGATLDLRKPDDAARLITSFSTLMTAETNLSDQRAKVLKTAESPVNAGAVPSPRSPGERVKTVEGADPGKKMFDGSSDESTVAPFKDPYKSFKTADSASSKGA